MMLNAITLKRSGAAIVHVNWQRDRDCALGIHQPLAIVFVDTEVIGDDLELVAGHFKNFVVVNRHETKSGYPPEKCRCYLRRKNLASNAKRRKASCSRRRSLGEGA